MYILVTKTISFTSGIIVLGGWKPRYFNYMVKCSNLFESWNTQYTWDWPYVVA